MNPESQHIHIVGICGVATSAIAIAFKDLGWKVTGSDKGFYPPVSTELSTNGIEYYAGWHPENIGTPNMIMSGGGGTSPSNPEIMYAKEHNIPTYSYPEIIQKYFIKKYSIVTAGTWGKTTTSSLLSFILTNAGLDPSYFTGGLSLSHKNGRLTDSSWSVVEGDEYQVSISDKRPKFVYYSPTYLLLTSVSWDHADLYPTEDAYFNVFKDLVSNIPADGMVIACTDNSGVKNIISESKAPVTTYGTDPSSTYRYHSVEHTREGLRFQIGFGDEAAVVVSPMLGRFNAENITACFAMAHSLGIDTVDIVASIRKFKGIKRRFEKRFEGEVTVLDCHAPTPEKAASVLESIKEVYNQKIIAIYEPNIGGRQHASAAAYDAAFKSATTVLIPRLTKLKTGTDDTTSALEGSELTALISKTHSDVKYIENDEELVTTAVTQAKAGDVIVFLGSHGFRGMIEEIVKKVK